MRTLFDGEVDADYHQIYVVSGGTMPDDGASFAGQSNGLCGGASPGFLFLTTGLQCGQVGFTVERHDGRPPLDDAWEDVVEVSFRPSSPEIVLLEWGGAHSWPLDLEIVDLRVRYAAQGLDQASEAGRRAPDEPMLDRYLLQFWPEAPGPDRVLKESTRTAAYWHGVARERPPPPPPPSPEDIAEHERQAEIERLAAARAFEDQVRWEGNPPSERVRNVGGNAAGLAALDRPLVEALARSDPDEQRAVARWAARRACDSAGISSLDWVARGLDALDRDEPLPPPLDDWSRAWETLLGKDIAVSNVHVVRGGGATPNIWPPAAALPALFGAADPDALRAAIDAIYAATRIVGDGTTELLAELRTAFPAFA